VADSIGSVVSSRESPQGRLCSAGFPRITIAGLATVAIGNVSSHKNIQIGDGVNARSRAFIWNSNGRSIDIKKIYIYNKIQRGINIAHEPGATSPLATGSHVCPDNLFVVDSQFSDS
jgi:hypothetical protein